jgi:Adenylate and Guanylate cyclase catalytic domain
MPVRLWQEVQALPRGAGRRVALSWGGRNPLCYPPSQTQALRQACNGVHPFGRFNSLTMGVACAVELQSRMAVANDGVADDRRIALRIGINLGDVVVESGDLYGDGVIIAVRLQAMAEPGGICIAGSVHEQVGTKLSLAFDDLGPCEVKNITKPVRTFRVRVDRPEEVVRSAERQPTLSRPSIALLPFTNMSHDPEQQYFSDGVTEDIITELSRFRQLFVIARNSSFRYRDGANDVKRIGRELGADYLAHASPAAAALFSAARRSRVRQECSGANNCVLICAPPCRRSFR